MPVPEQRSHLWVKMRIILRKIYKMADEYDYFFKADDDTYAVVENLRSAVQDHNPELPFMFGYRWSVLCPGGYFSGGPGYLLSRAALKRIVEIAIDKHPHCPVIDEDKEDVKMCLCGQAARVQLLDKYGETGLSLLYPHNLNRFFRWGSKLVEQNNPDEIYLRQKQFGLSEQHISFHYMDSFSMYMAEFILYHLDPFRDHKNEPVDESKFPKDVNDDQPDVL